MPTYLRAALVVGALAALCLYPGSVSAQSRTGSTNIQPPDRITRPINDEARVVRSGNRHPLARPEFDAGRVSADTRMERMVLQLQADAAQQQRLEALLAAQHDPTSTSYHQWITPEDYGRMFGVSDNDLNQVVSWLQLKGFEVEPVAEGRHQIIFSGTARQVEAAFRTEIHQYRVNGELHHANVSDPEIPSALAAVVGGIVSLHDFRAKAAHARIAPASLSTAEASPDFTSGSTHYLSPGDFATIYDLGPLYGSSTDGTGQSIAIVGRTNIVLSDVQTFRSRLGLPANTPAIVLNGKDPGVVSVDEQGEAELDTEWSGAVAKNAAIQLVVSGSTNTTDGVTLSAQYIVSHNLAPVVSMSFGACEAAMGSSENQFWNSLWQQAAAQGMSVFVSSGDSGAAGCDTPSANTAANGRGVNGICSSPYATCVGGTQFNDTANPAQYWSSTNSSTSASAQTYIPEAAWNESAGNGGTGLWSTGGGSSMMYTKPSWQTAPGVPSDGHRDVPDVALTAASHDGYLLSLNGQFYAASGTSASAPSFAGLMALVVQRQAARQGNANPVLYTMASNQVNGGSAVFHDVTTGNNTVPGVTGYNAGTGYDLATGLGSVDGNLLVNGWKNGGTATPSFQMSLTNPSVSVVQGAAGADPVTLGVIGGFNSAVTLSIGSLPPGLTANFSPAVVSAPGSGSSILTLTAGTQAAAGTYNLTVSGNGGGVTQTAPVTVTVSPTCAYSLNPSSVSPSAAGSNSSVTVMSTAGCSWTAASNVSWITLTGATSGNGNGVVGYSVTANTGTATRSGTLTIAGLTFTVNQGAATSGTFSLNPASATFGSGGANATVAVTAPSSTSAWTAKSNASWITITAGSSGTGNKSVSYSVSANTSNSARTGTMTIAGLTFTVKQAGPACTYGLSAGPIKWNGSAYAGALSVTSPSGCAWTATSSGSWITITAGASGSGNGTVSYTLAANTGTTSRSGSIVVAGYTLTFTEGVRGNVELSGPIRTRTRTAN